MQTVKRKNAEEITTVDKIFKAAAHLFAQKGYNGVSMREISQLTGVTKPAIYYYFRSKEEIYKKLLESALKYIHENLKRIMDKDLPVRDKLVEIIKIRFHDCLQYPEFVQFFISLITSAEKLSFLEEFKEEALKSKENLVRLIQSGVDDGEFGPSVNPEIAAVAIDGTVLVYILKQLNSDEIILSDQLASEIMEMFFKGLNE